MTSAPLIAFGWTHLKWRFTRFATAISPPSCKPLDIHHHPIGNNGDLTIPTILSWPSVGSRRKNIASGWRARRAATIACPPRLNGSEPRVEVTKAGSIPGVMTCHKAAQHTSSVGAGMCWDLCPWGRPRQILTAFTTFVKMCMSGARIGTRPITSRNRRGTIRRDPTRESAGLRAEALGGTT